MPHTIIKLQEELSAERQKYEDTRREVSVLDEFF